MGIEQSLEKKEAIVKEFGWDLTGDSPDNPRSKFFFEADAEKIMIFLEKDKLVIQQLEASLKESQDKVAQWITDYDELESENHRIQSRLQEAERDKLTEFAISEERQKKIERLEAELSRHKAVVEAAKKLPELECKNVGNFKQPHCEVCGFYEALASLDGDKLQGGT